MSRLQVEVDDFVAASRSMFHEVAESMQICLDGIDLAPELVGTDPAGEQWAAAYDPAARSVLAATAQTIDAAYATARLLAQSGHNYALAEAGSTTGARAADVPDSAEWGQLLAPQPRARVPVPPSAGGAGGDTPTGWWLVEHTLGYLWPGGHQDRLHTTAAQWRRMSEGITHVTGDLLAIATRFAADHLPEADDIITVCTTLRTRTDTLLAGYTQLADACDTYAHHLDQTHTAIVDELSDLLRDSAIVQGAGAVFAVFTLGASEAAAQTTQAGRIASAAARITTLIERLIAAAKRAAAVVTRVSHQADQVAGDLARFNGVAVTAAVVTSVRTAPAVVRVRELAALNSLSLRARGLAGLTTTTAQLAKKFKHAADWGLSGKATAESVKQFDKMLHAFVRHPSTVRLSERSGRYKGQPAIINYNPVTRMMVLQHVDGRIWSTWKLSAEQLYYVRKYGELR